MALEGQILMLLLKYLLEGFAVAVAAYLVGGMSKKATLKLEEIAAIGITAAATFAVLDFFAPSVGMSARSGSGFGLGARTVGWLGEGFSDCPVPEGAVVRNTAGAIMMMNGGALRPFTSMEHYNAWGAPAYQQMDDATLDRCAIGDPLDPTPESMPQVPNMDLSMVDPAAAAVQPPMLPQDPSMMTQDPSMMMQDPSMMTQDPSMMMQDPSMMMQDPSMMMQDPAAILPEETPIEPFWS